MRGNKRLVRSIAIAGVTGVLACTIAFPQQQIMQTEGRVQITESGTIGMKAAMSSGNGIDGLLQALVIEKNESYKNTAGAAVENIILNSQAVVGEDGSFELGEETEDESNRDTEDTEKQTEAQKLAEEKAKKKEEAKNAEIAKWEDKLMADVDDSLNIRKSPDKDSEIVGKLRKGDVADVAKKGKTWTKIKSGSVTGYVKTAYCVFGEEAYQLAQKVCGIYAIVQADGLRIRDEAGTDASILDVAYKGDKLEVDTKAKTKDGWIVVKCDGKEGYVSEEFVKTKLVTGKAISIEEEIAQMKAQEEAEQKAVSETFSTLTAAPPAQADLALLAAIIYCEAGGESYEGQIAVGAVVMNRVRSASFPNTISGVVYQSGQFTPASNGILARALANGSYKHCESAAREALAGVDNTGGARFFHRANGTPGLIIGNHVFF